MSDFFRIGIIGMGGYASLHHKALLRLEEMQAARLVCTADPNHEQFGEQKNSWKFSQRGVRVFKDYREMLACCAADIDLVVVATPIMLHAEMHRACVEARIACYLEKPPTLNPRELEQMIGVEQAARQKTLVGFNHILEPARLALKARLLAGDFGPVISTESYALWGRPKDYFRRNDWAGRLTLDGRPVLDSCFGNAMGHFVHTMLFWLGTSGVHSWAEVDAVRAQLYRANEIESADTFFVEASLSGTPTRFAFSHAGPRGNHHRETIVCEKATVHFIAGVGAEIHWRAGGCEMIEQKASDAPLQNHLEYLLYLRGKAARPATTLEDSRPFVQINCLAYLSSGDIATIPSSRLERIDYEKGLEFVVLKDWATLSTRFLGQGIWPGTDLCPGKSPVLTVTPADLPTLGDWLRKVAVPERVS